MKIWMIALMAVLALLPAIPAEVSVENQDAEVACIGGGVLRFIGGANRRARRSERRANSC